MSCFQGLCVAPTPQGDDGTTIHDDQHYKQSHTPWLKGSKFGIQIGVGNAGIVIRLRRSGLAESSVHVFLPPLWQEACEEPKLRQNKNNEQNPPQHPLHVGIIVGQFTGGFQVPSGFVEFFRGLLGAELGWEAGVVSEKLISAPEGVLAAARPRTDPKHRRGLRRRL